MRIIWGSLLVLSIALSAHAWAANFDDPIDGIYKGTYGSTISIQVPSLVSKSPDVNGNQDGDLSFQINPNTAYTNFGQLTDIKVGDQVRVQYTQDNSAALKDRQMVATSISVLGNQNRVVDTADVNTNNVTTTTVPATQTVTTVTTSTQ